MDFNVNPNLDVVRIAEQLARHGRLQIEDFLEPSGAEQLRSHLERSHHWRHLLNSRERTYEFASADWDALPAQERRKVDDAINENAAFEFQYQYDTIRVPADAGRVGDQSDPLERFALFLSSEPVLRVLRRITGADDLVYADCQATRYRCGDFLTPHNDEAEGMHRRFAYVLGLTPNWLPRWGGLLHFVDETGGVGHTITPRFNALSLFSVGQSHFVSQVATYAPVPRISVTGWLRSQLPA